MEQKARWRLAIRAVVVTTRSSVRSHRAWGKHHLEREAAERGLELLDELAERLPQEPDLLDEHAEARRTLVEIRDETPDDARGSPASGAARDAVADIRAD